MSTMCFTRLPLPKPFALRREQKFSTLAVAVVSLAFHSPFSFQNVKKIKVVNAVAEACGLKNVDAQHLRGEDEKGKYDFVVSRAVMPLPNMMKIVRKNISTKHQNALPNGVFCLKGGDLTEELKPYINVVEEITLDTFFDEDWFKEEKKLIYLPI